MQPAPEEREQDPARGDPARGPAAQLVRQWNFERTASPNAGGGFIRDPQTGVGYHITGTDANGNYIPPQVVGPRGQRERGVLSPPNFDLQSPEQIVEMFELIKQPDGFYRRPGYECTYQLQREKDGTFALYTAGGYHVSGGNVAPQTFHHGQWDRRRLRPGDPILPNQEAAPEPTPEPTPDPQAAIQLPPAVDAPTADAPGPIAETAAQITEPAPPFASLALPTGAPIEDSYHAEAEAVKRCLAAAAEVLSPERQAELQAAFADKKLVAGSPALSELINKTMAEISNAASHSAHLSPASDDLRQSLGLPEGTKVLVTFTGGRSPREIEQGLTALVKTMGDSIKLHADSSPLVREGDVVMLQAHTDPKSGTTLTRMSVISGPSAERKDWTVSTRDAQYIPRLFSNVYDRIDRNTVPREQPFAEWAAEHPQWTGNSTDPSKRTSLEQALQERDVWLKKQQEIAAAEAAEVERRSKEAPKQDKLLMKVGNHYMMGYAGWTIDFQPDSNAAFSAVDNTTGTVTKQPFAGIQFELTSPDGKVIRERIDSFAQLETLAPEVRTVIEHALTTPCEGDADRSLRRVADLFPRDVYRPGWLASFVYNQQSYYVDLLESVQPKYASLTTPEAQRGFLESFYESLKKRKHISADSVPEISAELGM